MTVIPVQTTETARTTETPAQTTARTTTTTTTTTTTMTPPTTEERKSDEDNECQQWLAKIESNPLALTVAPYHIRNNKTILMKAVKKDGTALEFATPELQNDKNVVMAAVKNNGEALRFAIPELRNDKEVVMAAVKNRGYALLFASPSLRNVREVIMTAIKNDRIGNALKYASPSLQNDKQVVMMAIQNYDDIKHIYSPLEFASPELRNDKEVVMAAVQKNGKALYFASPPMKNDKQVMLVAVQQNGRALELAPPELRQDRNVIITAVKQYPDAIKFVDEDLKRDPDVLTASGMFDVDHDDAQERQQQSTKVVLSTRFSLDRTSGSQATNFTALFKKSKYIQKFVVFAPNAFDKKTCDPEWTTFDHPCRGTIDTCQYTNILTAGGHPTDDCCWRYSFRSQLEEAKATNGFMLQLVETEPSKFRFQDAKDAKLGNGQKIEFDMASTMGIKVFQVYRPTYQEIECSFEDRHIKVITNEILRWYNDDNRDMSVTIIRQPYGDDNDV